MSLRQVRAMAHPLRLRMLEILAEGPSTASKLAERLGESSGATSYHLRELAKAGRSSSRTRSAGTRATAGGAVPSG